MLGLLKERSFNWSRYWLQKADEDIYPYFGLNIYSMVYRLCITTLFTILFIFLLVKPKTSIDQLKHILVQYYKISMDILQLR